MPATPASTASISIPVSLITLRMRQSQAMRVGYAALDYPFPAPTGIVDNRLRTVTNDFTLGHRGASPAIRQLRLQRREPHPAGPGITWPRGWRIARPRKVHRWRIGEQLFLRGETGAAVRRRRVQPLLQRQLVRDSKSRPVVFWTGPFVPGLPEPKRYYGSPWTSAGKDNVNLGATFKAVHHQPPVAAGGAVSFLGPAPRTPSTELFAVTSPQGTTQHTIIADPDEQNRSWSGEAQLAWNCPDRQLAAPPDRGVPHARPAHRIRRLQLRSLRHADAGRARYHCGCLTRPDFAFTQPNLGKVRQTAAMLGYLGELPGVARINLGIQRARFSRPLPGQRPDHAKPASNTGSTTPVLGST